MDNQNTRNGQLELYIQNLLKQNDDLKKENHLLNCKNQQLEADNKFDRSNT